jgi:hypothetical protein
MSYRGTPYGARVKFTVVVLSEAQRNPGGVIAAFIGKAIADTTAQIDELVQQARDKQNGWSEKRLSAKLLG